MKSIYFRHFLTTSMMILLSFLVLGSSFMTLAFQYLSSERQAQLKSASYYVSDYTSNSTEYLSTTRKFIRGDKLVFSVSSYFDYVTFLVVLAQVTDTNIFTVDAAGEVLACSDSLASNAGIVTCDHLGKTVPQEAMQSVLNQGGFAGMSAMPEIFTGHAITVGTPVYSPSGAVVGAVFAYIPSSDLNGLMTTFLSYFMMAALVVLVVSNLLAYYVSRKLTRPLTQMSRAAREFAKGNFDIRVPALQEGQDEVNQLARAFNAMAESMEHSEQLRRDFIANVSHELRTPMTTIAGYVDGILDGTIPPERQGYYLQIIRDEVHRLSRLVMSMLEIARVQSGSMTLNRESFDICEQVSRTVLGLEEKIRAKELDVSLDLPKESLMVSADRDKLTQVIFNLVDNAVKFAAPGTTLELRVAPQGDRAMVSVADTGVEISPEDLQHVFDRFHKADRSRGKDKGGLGLGLYIVKTILSAHDERVWAESQGGKTTFTFTLKLDDGKLKLPPVSKKK